MNPRVLSVQPLDNYKLKLKFTDNSLREFDMKPYLNYPVFEDLKKIELFNAASIFLGTVKWNDDIDMSPDTLFLESQLLS